MAKTKKKTEFTEAPPKWCRQIINLPLRGRWLGGASSDIVDCHQLGSEAWGLPDRQSLAGNTGDSGIDQKQTGLTAFTYLWRRFGPPFSGSDPHKELCEYCLGTPHKKVLLRIYPTGSGLPYGVGYSLHQSLEKAIYGDFAAWHVKYQRWCVKNGLEAYPFEAPEKEKKAHWAQVRKELGKVERPTNEKWRKQTGPVHDVNLALWEAMRELLRPVFIRDTPINLLGRVAVADDVTPAERSKYAGYGVPFEAMESWIKTE